MRVRINGFFETLPQGTSVLDVILRHEEYDVHMIVEVNHRFIHQKDYETTLLKDGDEVELIHPAFGG
jgi:sulfur carrier protein